MKSMLMPGINPGFLITLLLLSVFLQSCSDRKQDTTQKKNDIAPVTIGIHRYELALFPIDPQTLETGLPPLSKEYSFFLGDEYLEPQNLDRLKGYLSDSLIRSLFKSTKKAYPNLDTLETELGQALAYYRKSFPDKKTPEVYTYISGLDYENPVRFVDSVLLIGLDMYLGSSAPYYQQLGIPAYKYLGMDRKYIAGDCMKQIAFPLIRDGKRDKTLLDWMIMQGKVLYFLDVTLPAKDDALKIAYTPAQLDWCKNNEEMIWSFFISQKLLYNTDKQQLQDFIADAPFTKGFPKESPGRAGVWTGWQIVRAYMKNNPKINMQELFNNEDAQKILQSSGYKPRK